MADEIIQELWKIKDAIADEHGCNLDSLSVYLRSRKHSENQRVVKLQAIKEIDEQVTELGGDSASLHPR
jgi:hypothetical protein